MSGQWNAFNMMKPWGGCRYALVPGYGGRVQELPRTGLFVSRGIWGFCITIPLVLMMLGPKL